MISKTSIFFPVLSYDRMNLYMAFVIGLNVYILYT